MLYPHSLLWHYLWVGPDLWQVALAIFMWRRGLHKLFPFFFLYAIYEAIETFTLYALDVLPSVSADTFWRTCFASFIIKGLIDLVVIREVFCHLARQRTDSAKQANSPITIAALLGALAALAAVHAPIRSQSPILSRVHILGEVTYILSCGLWLFTFLFAGHFHLEWSRKDFGIALGSSVSACVHLATFAVFANRVWFERVYLLDFLNMGTYHICVLIWLYYLLSPAHPRAVLGDHRVSTESETKERIRRSRQTLQPTRVLARSKS